MAVEFFSTPLDQLTADQIRQLIDVVPESQYLDFKERPRKGPSESDGFSDWESEAARKELAKDISAFANADGGWLVLGIRAQKESPATARAITAIPKPEILGEKLLASMASRISPPLHGVRARGIATDSDGSGVIVFRIPSSPNAPHAVERGEASLSVHIRRNSEARPMSMLEIQEMTLNMARRSLEIEREFERRSFAFRSHDIPDMNSPAFGYRISIIPARARYALPEIYNHRNILSWKSEWTFAAGDDSSFNMVSLGSRNQNFRPMLRGARSRVIDEMDAVQIDVSESGSVEYWRMSAPRGKPRMYLGWIIGDLLSALRVAVRVRDAANAPDTELLFTLEVARRRPELTEPDSPVIDDLIVIGLTDGRTGEAGAPSGRMETPVSLPIYSLAATVDLSERAVEILNDLYNAAELPHWASGLKLRDSPA